MTPQWMTAERLTKLAELCERDDHLCLKGHSACLEKSHYQWATSHQETVAVPVVILWKDPETGAIRKDKTSQGWKPVEVTVWEWESAYLHEAVVEETIASWKADDREERSLALKREQQDIQDGTYGRYGGFAVMGRDGALRSRFDPVARDTFMAQQPEFYLKATGMDGVHFRPVAVVRVPSTDICLYLDVSAAFVKTTSNQRRLARRRGKPVQEVTVEGLCLEAIRLWWARNR